MLQAFFMVSRSPLMPAESTNGKAPADYWLFIRAVPPGLLRYGSGIIAAGLAALYGI